MNRNGLWSVIGLSVVLLGLICLAAPAQAGSTALPPRPTPVPTAVTVSAIKGGLIRVRVDTALTALWTSVEWQDAAGNWHLVEGWQGMLEADHTKTWWVAEADWGKGPFRWVVRDRREGQSLGVSSAFKLPVNDRQVVEIKLTASR